MKTLLLNMSGEPLKLISWKKAVVLYLSGKVSLLEEYPVPLRSCYINMNKPAVVQLRTYHRTKYGVKLSRENIYARDQYICQYCGEPFATKELTLDHVLPESRGGKFSWTNLVTCCSSCNNKKDNKTPGEANMPLLKKPVQPSWMPAVLMKAIKYHEIPTQWHRWISWLDERSLSNVGQFTSNR